jgi:formyl-CoA transferase
VLVAGNGDSIFKRLMDAIGRQDLADAPDLANNRPRGARGRDRCRDWRLDARAQRAAVMDELGAAACRPARSTPPRTSPKTRITARAT